MTKIQVLTRLMNNYQNKKMLMFPVKSRFLSDKLFA